ncbi:MAG TPA: hypothetical protein VGJ96_00945 [Gemmatimonadaceae bacterium]|jgi:hypothetical protein
MTHENPSLRAIHSGNVQASYIAVVGAGFGVLLRIAGMIGGPVWLAAIGGGAAGFFGGRAVMRALFGGGEKLAKQLVFPDAEGTYAPQYSHIQALEVQEKHAEAFDAWMQVAAARPGNPSPLLRAADLKLRQLNEPAAALEIYEQVRRMPGIREEHVRYASQKIIDIHLLPGGDEGRALVELRRFITLFPEGREADGARAAIARIKTHQA